MLPYRVSFLVFIAGGTVRKRLLTFCALVGFNAKVNICMSCKICLSVKFLATFNARIPQICVLFNMQVVRWTQFESFVTIRTFSPAMLFIGVFEQETRSPVGLGAITTVIAEKNGVCLLFITFIILSTVVNSSSFIWGMSSVIQDFSLGSPIYGVHKSKIKKSETNFV